MATLRQLSRLRQVVKVAALKCHVLCAFSYDRGDYESVRVLEHILTDLCESYPDPVLATLHPKNVRKE